MDIGGLPLEIIISNGIFALLFVWLLFDTRSEAKARETRLIEQIDKQNFVQERIINSLERLEQQVSNLKKED